MAQVLTMGEVEEATTVAQITACFKVVQQLRPHLSEEKAFLDQVKRQMMEGYHLVYLQEGQAVKAVAGYRFLEFLAWGKVLYIDDLITDEKARRNGLGARLLNWIVEEAKKVKCNQIHLDSGYQRHDAHRLYLNHGFKIFAHHFAKDVV